MKMINPIHAKELEERNKKILKDKRSGKFRSWELVAKYRLSSARINQIVLEMTALGY